MNLIQRSAEVFLAPGPISVIGHAEIKALKSALAGSPRGRMRINAHPDSEDALHEMFIAIKQDSYIHPHKHATKSEAFHLVHGAVDIIVFEDDGEIRQVVPLSADGRSGAFYYRMSQPFYHTLVIRSDLLVVHEITNGPFRAGETLLAPFAPGEDDAAGVAAYRTALVARVAAFQGQV